MTQCPIAPAYGQIMGIEEVVQVKAKLVVLAIVAVLALAVIGPVLVQTYNAMRNVVAVLTTLP